MSSKEDRAFAELDSRGRRPQSAQRSVNSSVAGTKPARWVKWFWIGLASIAVIGFILIPAERSPAEKAAEHASEVAAERNRAEALATGVMQTAVRFQDYARHCAAASGAVERRLGDSSEYELYALVKEAENICRVSSEQVFQLELPGDASGADKEVFRVAVGECSRAFGAKASSYELMAKAIDGGLRPAVVQDFREKAAFANGQLESCHQKLDAIASKSGLKTPSLAGIE